MATFLEKLICLTDNRPGMAFYSTDAEGTPYKNPYDGLRWNEDLAGIPKPTKEQIQAITNAEVISWQETQRKLGRDAQYENDLSLKAKYQEYLESNPNASFSEYLDYLESL